MVIAAMKLKDVYFLGKVMTNLDSILKSRDITLPTKVRLVTAMVFPVVMYGCESWTVKKAERWRIDAFELWCWRTLESPLDCKEIQPVPPKGDQSWVFIGRTDVEAETPNTLATSCEELTHWKRPWCWEGLGAGGEGDDRGWDGWMASLTRWMWVWVNSRSWWWTGRPGVLRFMWSQRVGHDWVIELNWTELFREWMTLELHLCMGKNEVWCLYVWPSEYWIFLQLHHGRNLCRSTHLANSLVVQWLNFTFQCQGAGLIPGQSVSSIQSVQLLSRVWLFVTPWIAARQASLSITNCDPWWGSLIPTWLVAKKTRT